MMIIFDELTVDRCDNAYTVIMQWYGNGSESEQEGLESVEKNYIMLWGKLVRHAFRRLRMRNCSVINSGFDVNRGDLIDDKGNRRAVKLNLPNSLSVVFE